MGTTLNRDAYERVCAEDLEWLLKQPHSLERDHIEQMIKLSPAREYETGQQRIDRMLKQRQTYELELVQSTALSVSTAIRAETHGLLTMIKSAILKNKLEPLASLLPQIDSALLVGDPNVADDEMFNVLRDFALTALRGHEIASHEGKPCKTERQNMVAYIAHVLGVRAYDVGEHVTPKIVDYESTCPNCVQGIAHVETAEPLTQVDTTSIARKNRDEETTH